MSAPIIITLPSNYLTMESGDCKVGILDKVASPDSTSRKRRLDHLTWEEKLQRKKLKNRVAAQTSRDRKKVKMDEMEYRIQTLETNNEKLMKEMASLKALNERLISENESLRKQLSAARDAVGAGLAGPAASLPQQQDGPAATVERAARLVLAMCLLSQTSSHKSTLSSTSAVSSNLPRVCSRILMQKIAQDPLQIPPEVILRNVGNKMNWWGPHQSNWNPVKVQS